MIAPSGETLTMAGAIAVIAAFIKFGDRLWKKEETSKMNEACCAAHRDMSEKIDALLASQREMHAGITEFIRHTQEANAILRGHTEKLTELIVTARTEQQTSATRHESMMRSIMENR